MNAKSRVRKKGKEHHAKEQSTQSRKKSEVHLAKNAKSKVRKERLKVKMNQGAFIEPPQRIPLLLRLGIWFSEKVTGRKMLPARILAWYPKAALGSGVLEALVAHHDRRLDERLLKLVRIAASYAAACPFCIDMNSYRWLEQGISQEELDALQGKIAVADVASFSLRERLAVEYARLVSQTPLKFHPEFIDKVKGEFNEREMVILASTAAQVNYWARLIQALGIPPAGFGSG